jgi:UDP-glucose 4-epimerase
VEKIIFGSSSEVYGDIHKNNIKEANPVSPKSVYGVSKLAGEEYCKAYYQRYGLKACIVRFCNIYGPGQVVQFVIPRYCRSALADEPLTVYGDGKQIRAFCNVRDAAKGVIKALEYDNDKPEIFNIGNSNNAITMKELAELVIRISGKKIGIKFLDFKDSDRSEDREIFKRIPSIEKARRLIGYEPTVTLEEGIKDMLSNPDLKDEWAIKEGRVGEKA